MSRSANVRAERRPAALSSTANSTGAHIAATSQVARSRAAEITTPGPVAVTDDPVTAHTTLWRDSTSPNSGADAARPCPACSATASSSKPT